MNRKILILLPWILLLILFLFTKTTNMFPPGNWNMVGGLAVIVVFFGILIVSFIISLYVLNDKDSFEKNFSTFLAMNSLSIFILVSQFFSALSNAPVYIKPTSSVSKTEDAKHKEIRFFAGFHQLDFIGYDVTHSTKLLYRIKATNNENYYLALPDEPEDNVEIFDEDTLQARKIHRGNGKATLIVYNYLQRPKEWILETDAKRPEQIYLETVYENGKVSPHCENYNNSSVFTYATESGILSIRRVSVKVGDSPVKKMKRKSFEMWRLFSHLVSPPAGSVVIQQHKFFYDGEPTAATATLPQQLNNTENATCNEAGYSLTAYRGEKITIHKYNVRERYANEPLYLWVLKKDPATICAYFSARESSDIGGALFAVNDSRIR